ncbi:hypothetical protein COT97_01045 [Candidatus Falkowbacteria bacterium CG10_big_fil_rev_8_21_14_0_10_39_11]|uniref:histidine kinase n=1 Tax=Candidatus Falkowbacteria bacterium CG10_big_fil_rev_8_21_14_0_10_39_11 TaxID=1974565 RepID=A0A2H0V618_9BACT|nr:MAG: hypothetical protein COT97_01045 [Candidatus Falkowbacteria bacterium CG10_big_fil_rev_8_21_14_0_10_39_11]
MKQRYKVLVLFLLISLIPLIMSVGWGVYTVKKAQDQGFSFLQTQITRAISNNLSLYFQQKIENASIQVVQDGISDISSDQQKFILSGLIAKDPTIVEASVVNRGGIEKNKIVNSKTPTDFVLTNRNVVNEQFFQVNREGKYFIDAIETQAGGKTVLIASPILSSDGEFLGSLLTRLYLTDVEAIINQVKQTGYGYAYVVDGGKNLLLTTDNIDIDQINIGLSVFASEKSYQDFQVTGEAHYNGLQGDLVTGTIDKIPTMDWWVVVEWPVSDMFDVIKVNLVQLAILSLIVLLIAAVISLVFVNRVNNQLNQVIEGAKVIDKGNLKFRIKAPTNDELEDLSTAINNLADKLERCKPESEDKPVQTD